MKHYLSLILCAGLSAGAALAGTQTEKVETPKAATEKTTNKISEKSRAIEQDVASAMNETKKALSFLDQSKKKEAQDALKSATGKLEMVVARRPELGLAAFDLNVTTNALLNDVKSVNAMKEEAIRALKDNRVQEARQITSMLRSDTVITVASIPLETYPMALKDAARLIDQDKLNEAKMAITTALSTVVMTETIIPLPLARADFYIGEADKLSQKKNRTKEENAELSRDITSGREALLMAEALGYAPKNAFKESLAKLDTAKTNAEAGNSGSNWFKDVKEKITSFFGVDNSDQKQAQEAE